MYSRAVPAVETCQFDRVDSLALLGVLISGLNAPGC
jgi:hypothetical protein